MKTNESYRVNPRNINSLDDLKREKERLQLEIVRREDNISHHYHNLADLFSFRNILGAFFEEVNTATTIIGKLITLGKGFIAKRKKKKKSKSEIIPEENAG